MAKGRLIDKGILENEKFATLIMLHRQLLIGMVLVADDQGRLKGSPAWLRAKIFPYDDVPLSDIDEGAQAIVANGTAQLYEVDGKSYIQLLNWWEYQSLQWAQPSDYPSPDGWQDRIRYMRNREYIEINWREGDPNLSASLGIEGEEGSPDSLPDAPPGDSSLMPHLDALPEASSLTPRLDNPPGHPKPKPRSNQTKTKLRKREEAAVAASLPPPTLPKLTKNGPDPPLQVFKPGMDFLDMAAVTEEKQAEMRARGIDNPAEVAAPLAGWPVNDEQVKEVLLEFIALSKLKPATKKKRKGWEAGARECFNVFGDLDKALAAMRTFFRIRADDGDDRFKFDIASPHSLVNSLGVIRDDGHERGKNAKSKQTEGRGAASVRGAASRESAAGATGTTDPDRAWADTVAAYKADRT